MKEMVRKSCWSINAMLAGPFWYLYRGMVARGLLLLIFCLATLGVGVLPVWSYCGFFGNRDFYRHLKRKSALVAAINRDNSNLNGCIL